MISLKWFLFKTKLSRGDFDTARLPKFAINHGDRVWIGENPPTDTTIKFWILGSENTVKEVHRSKILPSDTNKLWLEV